MAGKGAPWRGKGWRIAGWSVTTALLMLPLAAMQFTDEVNWTAFDFAVFGAMLAGAGGAFEVAVRATAGPAWRIAAGIAIAAAFLLLWLHGAVGIF